jgi:hypothetical protein
MKRFLHCGHSTCEKSTSLRSFGGIEYPHFGHNVPSAAKTLARSIFCFFGIPDP